MDSKRARTARALQRLSEDNTAMPSGDWATGITHPLANTFCFLVPSLRRRYRGDDFILESSPANNTISIQQSYYYRHTPGHNPLLVNRFIEPASPSGGDAASAGDALRFNLLHAGQTLECVTSPRGKGQSARRWSITFPPTTQAFMDFSRYRADGHSFRPVVWESQGGGYVNADTPYWIIRCPKEIIKGHNDIWSQQAMDTYAALYAISLALGQKKP